MKIKRTLFLFFFPALILGLADIVASPFMDGNRLPASTSQPLSSDHSYKIAKEYQKQHETSLENAIEHYRRALDDPETTDLARFELGTLFYEKGDFERAIQHLERLGDGGPDHFMTAKMLGLSYLRLHQYARALQHLKRAQKLNPKNPEVLYSLGLIYEEENFAEEAKGCFREAIDVSPRSFWGEQAKAHLQVLLTENSGTTVSEIQDEEVRRLILEAPGQDDYPNAGAIVILDQEKLIIHSDMTQTREIHKVIKILNDRGKWRAEAKVHYNSLEETVHVGIARTIRPNGTIVNVGKEAMRDLTLWAGFPMYSNAKYKVISMPEVEDGAIIEYKATISSSELPFGKFFSDYFGFQDYEPIIVCRYMVEIPESTCFKTLFINTDSIQPRIERIDLVADNTTKLFGVQSPKAGQMGHPYVRYTWERRDIPAIKWERRMPGWVDVSPIIMISSCPDWRTFYQWWWDLSNNRIRADDAIREKVAELTRGKSTQGEKALAIYHYVAAKIRYVGLEYGEGGFRPHYATEVFSNKYGDCKDKAILLVAMLREAGISAQPVLIGTRCCMWDLQRSIAMSQFNHCIVIAEVGARTVWLDPTDETCSYGDLPGYDQGRLTLAFYDDGPRFPKTPVIQAKENLTLRDMKVVMSASGVITVEAKTTFRGVAGRQNRYHYKNYTPEERVDLVKDMINGLCPGATLQGYRFSDLEDLSVPVTLEYQFSVRDYAKKAGDFLLFRVPGLSRKPGCVGKETRTHPLTWNNTYSEKMRALITIPEGYRVRYLPENMEINLPFAFYKLEYKHTGGKIVLETLRKRLACKIGPDQYPQYKKYEEKIAKELDKPIILERVRSSGEINEEGVSL